MNEFQLVLRDFMSCDGVLNQFTTEEKHVVNSPVKETGNSLFQTIGRFTQCRMMPYDNLFPV